jgi:hypothetical protein
MPDNYPAGHCLCGAIQYRINGEFRNLCFCHCRSCRTATGAPYVAWGTINTGLFEITRGRLQEYGSSPGVTRGFCGNCGTSLTYRHEKRPEEIDVCLVTLADAARFKPEFHLWVSAKLPWIHIHDGLPQYPEWRTE